jgi:hypothetical protein
MRQPQNPNSATAHRLLCATPTGSATVGPVVKKLEFKFSSFQLPVATYSALKTVLSSTSE